MSATVPRPTGPRVVVVGAINVDFVVVTERLPGPGETVVGPRVERHGGGKGANAAVAAARAGADVSLVGAVGDDDTGRTTLDELRGEGVRLEHVVCLSDEPTGVALIVVDARAENQIAVGAGANAAVTVDHVLGALATLLPDAGCVLVSTEIPGDAVAAAVGASTAAGVRCLLNPAPVIPVVHELVALGPVLTPNGGELDDLVAGQVDGDASARAVFMATRTGCPLIVTLGRDGALIAEPDASTRTVPAPHVTVRDTTGAGDTFNGVLATRIAAGDSLDTAVRVAVTAASLSVAEIGARDGMPTAAAIDAAFGR